MSETEASRPPDTALVEKVASIVMAYVAHNAVRTADLPDLIETVHGALKICVGGVVAVASESMPELVPAVSVRKSITPDFLICLEDGKRFKSLRRHLMSKYGLTPEGYRKKWGLAADYPMVAPAYAATRSALARASGLGQRGQPEINAALPDATENTASPAAEKHAA